MISVVIPAFNEEKHIRRCLESLLEQTTNEPFEVIVVDNASTDQTSEIAMSFTSRLTLTVVHEKIQRRGAARATGFQAATGDIILSTDADTEVPPFWIDAMIAALHEHPNIAAVTGPSEIHDCGPLTNTIYNITIPLAMRTYALFAKHHWLNGCNFAIRKSTYHESGGLDPRSDAQEDNELSDKVHAFGKIRFVPDIPVRSSGRRFRKGLLAGATVYMKTFAKKFFFKRNDVLMEKID